MPHPQGYSGPHVSFSPHGVRGGRNPEPRLELAIGTRRGTDLAEVHLAGEHLKNETLLPSVRLWKFNLTVQATCIHTTRQLDAYSRMHTCMCAKIRPGGKVVTGPDKPPATESFFTSIKNPVISLHAPPELPSTDKQVKQQIWYWTSLSSTMLNGMEPHSPRRTIWCSKMRVLSTPDAVLAPQARENPKLFFLSYFVQPQSYRNTSLHLVVCCVAALFCTVRSVFCVVYGHGKCCNDADMKTKNLNCDRAHELVGSAEVGRTARQEGMSDSFQAGEQHSGIQLFGDPLTHT